MDVQINVRWCCAAGELWDRNVECGSAGGVVQLGTRMSPTRPRCRKRTAGSRWIIAVNQIRRSGAYPETRPEDVAEQAIQAFKKVPDMIDSINKETKCTRKTKEKLLGARKALESSTQMAAIAHESRKRAEEAITVAEFAFASPREPPERMSPGPARA